MVTWNTIFDQLMSASTKETVVALIKLAVTQELNKPLMIRRATYSLLKQTLYSIKEESLEDLRVDYVLLGSGAARLKAPIPPTPMQLQQFDELWSQLATIKTATVNHGVLIEVTSPLGLAYATLENRCFTEAELLLQKFKPLSNPLQSALTEKDISIFWED
jgi:hypothetical protein